MMSVRPSTMREVTMQVYGPELDDRGDASPKRVSVSASRHGVVVAENPGDSVDRQLPVRLVRIREGVSFWAVTHDLRSLKCSGPDILSGVTLAVRSLSRVRGRFCSFVTVRPVTFLDTRSEKMGESEPLGRWL